MKISFYQQQTVEPEKQYTEKAHVQREEHRTETVSAAGAVFARGGDVPGGPAGRNSEKGKSLAQLQQEAGNIDAGVRQDYMTLMSNTMSEEDYAKLQEEGFDFSGMEPEEAVTIVDKIKAELVRSGKAVAGYTDDLDMETLAAALGSDTLARAVADSFAEADVPLTKENLAAVAQAWAMGSELQPMEDGARGYLIDNELKPEIWNLYLAENSGAEQGSVGVPRFYEEDVKGYYIRQYTGGPEDGVASRRVSEEAGNAQGPETAGLRGQIDRIITQSGREVNEESREMASWLLDRGLPLTGDNLDRLEELRRVELPLNEETFARAAADAVAAGKSPVRAVLGREGGSLYGKAAAVAEYYHGSQVWEASAGDITARRQLEEIRLRMTAEVNIKLLKSGFSIDTAPMEQLVEALRQAERELAGQYFPGDAQAVEKYRLYQNTNAVLEEIPGLPADVLGRFAQGGDFARTSREGAGVTPEELHREGRVLQESYEKAQIRYEELMTAPRADMGDSIRKAFANVDDILEDMNMEPTDENRRAVRILGYNRMEVTPENLEAVSEADRQVKQVIERLTPAATLKMIRDGINPLEKSFDELKRYFDGLPEEYREAAESYSRYLYGLERNNKITREERESYIGVYRLVRQIEKTDGAAVGAVVNTQAELQFANLLTAVRTGRVKFLDKRAADDIGTVAELMRKGESIPAQIARAFGAGADRAMREVSYSREAQREYDRQELETMRQAVADADARCTAMLQRGELPCSADNLIAAQALVNGGADIFGRPVRRGINKGPGDGREPESVRGEEAARAGELTESADEGGAGLWESLDRKEEFRESYVNAVEEALKAAEEATFEADFSVDVRRMQLLHKQLNVASALAEKEEYFLPMYVGGTLTGVHLTFDRAGENKGSVAVDVNLEEGRIHADFLLENGELSGNFTPENQNEVMKLQRIADTFTREAAVHWTVGSISVTAAGSGTRESAAPGAAHTESAELYRVAKVFLESLDRGEVEHEN